MTAIEIYSDYETENTSAFKALPTLIPMLKDSSRLKINLRP